MKAIVISGGGSKGAFAGGVAEYLMTNKSADYDIFIGTSTGSLLIPHLALRNIEKIKNIYTNVTDQKIFDVNPFRIKKINGENTVSINHLNVLRQFFNRKRTFGENHRLLSYIKDNFSPEEFLQLKNSEKKIIITVSNLSLNCVEYKSINDFEYDEFCEWIWISCNYVPFMSLALKNKCKYGDGGFTNLVPIREAINRGATEIDAIVLETETQLNPKIISKNPFSLMLDLFQTLLNQNEKHNITIGKLAAKNKDVKLNFYYTPTKLTNNALVFDKVQMTKWWQMGYDYAENKSNIMSDIL